MQIYKECKTVLYRAPDCPRSQLGAVHSRVTSLADIVKCLTEPSPLNLIAIGRGVLLVDPLADDHPVLVHGVVSSDNVLLDFTYG